MLEVGAGLARELVVLLACPIDGGELEGVDGDLGSDATCRRCGRQYRHDAGVLRMLPNGRAELDEAQADESLHAGYTDRAELPPMLAALGAPRGPILELGAGGGRLTVELAAQTGQPVVAIDHRFGSLALLVQRCAGLPVLAVHADVRQLPLRANSFATATAADLYPTLPADGRRQLLAELSRVLELGGRAVISTRNDSAAARAGRRLGHRSASGSIELREAGAQVRLSPATFREELEAVFTVERVDGVRNIPGGTLAATGQRLIGRGDGRPDLERWMEQKGVRLDHALVHTPIGRYLGEHLLATVRNEPPDLARLTVPPGVRAKRAAQRLRVQAEHAARSRSTGA